MHRKYHFSFMERIVYSLYADKRRLIRLVFSVIMYMSYNAYFYSILYVTVLKRRFSILLTAWVAAISKTDFSSFTLPFFTVMEHAMWMHLSYLQIYDSVSK